MKHAHQVVSADGRNIVESLHAALRSVIKRFSFEGSVGELNYCV